MKALCWHGFKDVRIENIPDPQILNPKDAIIEVKKTAVCGSDLHIYHGMIMGMKQGDVLGHEFAGEVVAVGSEVRTLKVGDRVVVPFTISCGSCRFCLEQKYSSCDNTNPNGTILGKLLGYPSAGLYGYSHLFGGYPGGQAEFVRVPYADTDSFKIPDGVDYEEALFLSDIFPTGYQAAENLGIKPGETVAVWGCGPVGQFAIKSCFLLGAERVFAIDRFTERLTLAQRSGAIPINYEHEDVMETLNELTGGRGPTHAIDAVGMEAHGSTLDAAYDEMATKLKLETDRCHALRQAIYACGKGGTIAIAGVYVGIIDKFPIGIAFGKGLTLKLGQTHVQRHMAKLMELITNGTIDPTFVITHRWSLADAPMAYKMFGEKDDQAIKFVLTP